VDAFDAVELDVAGGGRAGDELVCGTTGNAYTPRRTPTPENAADIVAET
jgi:hypothetical protein